MLLSFLLVLCSAGAIHRIWIYEDIAKPIRDRVIAGLTRCKMLFFVKMLTCPPCFAFWACVAAVAVWWWAPVVALVLALYSGLRLTMEGMSISNKLVERLKPIDHAKYALPAQPAIAAPTLAPTPAPLPSCGVCGKQASSKRKIVIFTVFNSLARSYSLVGVALDQARALVLSGYSVEFWTTNGSDLTLWPKDMPPQVVHLQIVPHIQWKDDVVVPSAVVTLRDFIKTQVARLPLGTVIITHDLQFITSYVSFAQALRDVGETPKVRWLHMAHSRAGSQRPTHFEGILRSSLVDGHDLLYPSPSDVGAMAAYFGIEQKRVWIAPNIRDVASQNRWTPLAKKIANDAQLMQADIVQVYPYSTPRAKAKGVDTVIRIFGALKDMGNSVRLVLVSAHNHGDVPKVETERIKKIMEVEGLSTTEVVFTSDRYTEAFDGVSGDVVADLQQVANVFIFPSTSESCGLVMLEAGINGQLLVLNEALPTMFDAVDRSGAIYLPFGQNTDATSAEVIVTAAERIDMHLRSSMENLSRRGLLRQYSLRAGGEALVAAVEGVWKVDK